MADLTLRCPPSFGKPADLGNFWGFETLILGALGSLVIGGNTLTEPSALGGLSPLGRAYLGNGLSAILVYVLNTGISCYLGPLKFKVKYDT